MNKFKNGISTFVFIINICIVIIAANLMYEYFSIKSLFIAFVCFTWMFYDVIVDIKYELSNKTTDYTYPEKIKSKSTGVIFNRISVNINKFGEKYAIYQYKDPITNYISYLDVKYINSILLGVNDKTNELPNEFEKC